MSKPVYISPTRYAMPVALTFLVIFGGLLSGMLWVDGLATWWFLLIIVAVALVFYGVSLYAFVSMEFYDELVVIRHLLKPRNPQRIVWDHVSRVIIERRDGKTRRITVIFAGRKERPFSFSIQHDVEKEREALIALLQKKGVELTETSAT